MIKKLPFLALLVCASGFSQSPIGHFSGALSPELDGISGRIYERGTFATPVDESATGADASWDFSSVAFNLTQTYANGIPSENEIALYPGTNFKTGMTSEEGETAAMFSMTDDIGGFTILGNEGGIYNLKFDTDAAFVGVFPMSFGYTNDDTVAGTFLYNGPLGNFSGSFSGTMTSQVDAYGELTFPDPANEGSNTTVSATRLKVTLQVTFGTPEFPNAGTLTQISNYYYTGAENDQWPKIRSLRNQVSVPLLSINDDTTVLERSLDVTLGTADASLKNIVLYPNPASDRLYVSSEEVKSIKIASMDGKIVASASGNSIGIENLVSGMYIVNVETESGIVSRKFIRK